MNPKISILLSIFKPNPIHFKKTIDSIKIQTMNDYELIIIKDDSEQSTLDVIKKYTQDFKNFTLIDNLKNIGLVASLNKGLHLAKGEYIARIDVGDWWHKEKLLAQYKLAIKHSLVLIGTQVNFFSADLIPRSQSKLPSSDTEIRAYFSRGRNPFVHSSVMFKRLEGVFYNENALHTEDYELWCRYYFLGKMLNLEKFLTNYVVDMNSITSSKRYLMYANAATVYINFIKSRSRSNYKTAFITSLIKHPRDEMTFFEKKFSFYYSLASYERLISNRISFLRYILIAFLFKPQILFIFFKKKVMNFYYKHAK